MSDDSITAAADFPEEFKQLMNTDLLDLMGKILNWHLSQQGLSNIHINQCSDKSTMVTFSQRHQG